MSKYLITNVYCYQNRGDAGIIYSMIDNIRSRDRAAEITLMSLWPYLDQGRYGNVEVVPSILPISRIKNKYLRGFSNLNRLVGILISGKFGFSDAKQAFRNADIVVSCGGGFMQCRNIKEFLNVFIYHYAQLYYAKRIKKDYIVFAQTIGPFNNITIKILSSVLKKAKAVLSREKISFNYVKTNFPTVRNILTGDAAFLLNPAKEDQLLEQSDNNKTKVGITVRHWLYPGYNSKVKEDNYVTAIVKFIIQLQHERNYEIYFMSQVIGPLDDDDRIITRKILSLLENTQNVHLIGENLDPRQLKRLYGQMDFFVGTRMHSNIFALGEGIPCLAISYDQKTNGIMQAFGLDEYVIDINSIQPKQLITKFHQLRFDVTVREHIKEILPIIRENADKNFDVLDNVRKKLND